MIQPLYQWERNCKDPLIRRISDPRASLDIMAKGKMCFPRRESSCRSRDNINVRVSVTITNLIIVDTNKRRQQLSRTQASSLTDEHINQLFWYNRHQGRRKLVEQVLPVLTLQDIQSWNVSKLKDTESHSQNAKLWLRMSECWLGKAMPVQPWTCHEASRRLRLPDFETIGTYKW
jgi:hypothetical protein